MLAIPQCGIYRILQHGNRVIRSTGVRLRLYQWSHGEIRFYEVDGPAPIRCDKFGSLEPPSPSTALGKSPCVKQLREITPETSPRVYGAWITLCSNLVLRFQTSGLSRS